MKITFESVNVKKPGQTKMNQSLDDVMKNRQAKFGRANTVKTTTKLGTGKPSPITFNKRTPITFNKPSPITLNKPGQPANKKPQQKQQQQQQRKPQQQQRNTQTTKNAQAPVNQSIGPARLEVRNLGEKVTEADLFTLFHEFGEVLEFFIHTNRNQQRTGSGHVVFMRFADAMRGKRKYHKVTLDGRPMNIYVSHIENYDGNFIPLNPKRKGNVVQKPLKRLQKDPVAVTTQPASQQKARQPVKAPQAVKAPQPGKAPQTVKTRQLVTTKRAPQQIITQKTTNQGSKWIVAGQKPANVAPKLQTTVQTTKNLNLGLLPTPALGSSYSLSRVNSDFGLSVMPSAGSGIAGMARGNILSRLGDVEEEIVFDSSNGQTVPSVLDRLDGGGAGIIAPAAPRVPAIFNRLDGATNSGNVVQVVKAAKPVAAAGASILSRVGPNTGIQQRVGSTTGIQQRVGASTGIQQRVGANTGIKQRVGPSAGIQQRVGPSTGIQQRVGPSTAVKTSVAGQTSQLQTTKGLNLGLLPTPALGSFPFSLGQAKPGVGLNTMSINAASNKWSVGQVGPVPTFQVKRGVPAINQQQKKKATQQPQNNQPKKFKPEPKPQQQQMGKRKTKTLTAADLDAELDDYLSKMPK